MAAWSYERLNAIRPRRACSVWALWIVRRILNQEDYLPYWKHSSIRRRSDNQLPRYKLLSCAS